MWLADQLAKEMLVFLPLWLGGESPAWFFQLAGSVPAGKRNVSFFLAGCWLIICIFQLAGSLPAGKINVSFYLIDSFYLIEDHINKWIIICFTILSFQIHAVEDTCQLWNSSQEIGLNNNIPFHLYKQEQHYTIRYDTKISRNYTRICY